MSAEAVRILLALAVLASGCASEAPRAPARFVPTPDLVAANDAGVGRMGRFEFDEARAIFDDLARRAPGWLDVQVNLAIATLNRQGEGDEAATREVLERVLESDPEHLRAHYCLGLLFLNAGAAGEALPHLKKVADADPSDAYAAYYTGRSLFELARFDEAIVWFRRARTIDPYLRSAAYAAFQTAQRLQRTAEAGEMLEEFKKLEGNPQARTAEFKYTRLGPRAEATSVDPPTRPAPPPLAGAPFAAPAALPIDGRPDVRWAAGGARPPTVTAADLDNDGRIDLLIAGAIRIGTTTRNAVLLNRGDRFVIDPAHPLASITGVNAALWGDYDNDGLTDVYLCRRGPNQLWRHIDATRWADVTRTTRTSGGAFDTVDGAMFDADHDGDLDLFLVNADGPNELLNNNRDGTFRPIGRERGIAGDGRASRQVIVGDLDGDRDADLLVIKARPPHDAYLNDRLWTYHRAAEFDRLIATPIDAAVAGDVDANGRLEIYAVGGGSISRWQRVEGTWRPDALGVSIAPPRAEAARLALADIDGDGVLDLLCGTSAGWQVISFAPDGRAARLGFVTLGADLAHWAPVALAAADGPAVVGVPRAGAPIVWKAGPGRHPFVTIAVAGTRAGRPMRSNASGIGARLALRSASRWTVATTFRADSGPGQSLQPVSLGTGGAARADFVAIDWSDGVFQSEIALAAGALHRIEETERQLSSCPVLFAFDGRRDAFVTDLLGVGGIGFLVRPGAYGDPDPTENVLLPSGAIAPRDGRYTLKIGEPMEEVVYLDAARLIAYDLPPGWRVTLDERKHVSGPAPTGEPRFYRTERTPVAAVNDRGEDVTRAIAAADRRAAPPGRLDPRFIGLGAEHTIALRFSEPLDLPRGSPMLIADGWIEYPYAQTMFAAWQAGAAYRAPTLEARGADGVWRVVLREFGYPAGMPRQMSVPLPALPPGTRELRLRTNQEIYWDRLSVAYAEPLPAARRRVLPLVAARVQPSGFARRTTGPQRQPHYDYQRRSPLWDARHPGGLYTAFGPSDELVASADDAVAIVGPGEEIHLEFAAPPHAPTAAWSRHFVLEAEGWCKDMDLLTKDGETVEPLPSTRRGRSPHRADLHRRHNTRYEPRR